ncbi:MAG: hypothetical protein FJX57_25170, partial [Alphaproteobacteria bacterium]|nr:hypothetical protein [Alphaproteobacteria bacterium]
MPSITRTGPMVLPTAARRHGVRAVIRRHPTAVIGAIILALMVAMAIFAPLLWTIDP